MGKLSTFRHQLTAGLIEAIIGARNAANGYLGLGADGKADAAQLPSIAPADGSITTAKLAANAASNGDSVRVKP